jgi:hypothetical protein
MQAICPKSGATLFISPRMERWAVNVLHPLFYTSLEDRVNLVLTEWTPAASTEDKLLMFVALADCLHLIDWHEGCPAKATLWSMEIAIPSLLKLAALPKPVENLPRVSASEASSMKSMLDEVFANLDQIKVADWLAAKRERLEVAATQLVAREGKEKRLLRVVAQWALEMTRPLFAGEGVVPATEQLWLEILQTPASAVKAANWEITDVQELQEFMLANLPIDSKISLEVHNHLETLTKVNIIESIGIPLVMVKPKTTPKPVRESFPDTISYARALAAWHTNG